MSKKVLAVCNNPVKLETLKDALEKGGYDTVTLLNKAELVSFSKELNPDLILLDIEIPIKEGYRICKELRESPLTKDIKVIIIKNKDDPLQKSWSVVEGSSFYLACKNSVRGDSLIQSMSVVG